MNDNAATPTKKEEEKRKLLYDRVVEEGGDIDIGDIDWDWWTCFDCHENWEETEDYYDKFMLLFALSVEIDEIDRIDACKFIMNNKEVLEEFFNEQNKVGYRPKDYDDPQPDTDDGFYEAYLMPLESLLIGNYSEEDYKWLYQKLLPKMDQNLYAKAKANERR